MNRISACKTVTESDRVRMADGTSTIAKRRALRAIAAFEAIKGLAAFAGIVGVLDLMHHDARHLAIELIGRFGLNPDAYYPSILLHYADLLPSANVRLLVAVALVYIFVRVLEAYGLWNDRVWAEWLAALSGAVYVPFEFGHLMHRLSAISVIVLAANICVVSFLAIQLWRSRIDAITRQ